MKRYEFLKIIARETDYLTNAARKLGIDHPEQAVNDVVIDMLDKKTYRQFDTLKGSVRSYVYASVKYRGINILRRTKYEGGLFVPLEALENSRARHNPDASAIPAGAEVSRAEAETFIQTSDFDQVQAEAEDPDHDTIADVRLAVATLKPREQDLVRLVYMGPESVESAAELLGITIPEAQEALRSAKEALRAKLADYAPGKPA